MPKGGLRWTEEERGRAVALYRSGLSIRAVSRAIGVSYTAARRCLRGASVDIRPRAQASGLAQRTHGKSRTRAYRIWVDMRRRCMNQEHAAYRLYGARGIVVCDAWAQSFAAFYADMGDPPAGRSLDRIDNDGHYRPGNCRWATAKEQGRNKRNCVLSQDERASVERAGLQMGSVRWRLRHGWPIALAISLKPDTKQRVGRGCA